MVSLEGDSFPDDVGWIRSDRLYLAGRTLDNGAFLQSPRIIQANGSTVGQDDFYQYSLNGFSGSEAFFAEWRVETTGSRDEMVGVGPASFVFSGDFGILYHFTIASNRVLFLRDSFVPAVWVDIDPGVPHEYRLNLFGEDLYEFFIDGDLIDFGVPEGVYSTEDSRIVFGARSVLVDSTTSWDYIRFGMIPEDGSEDYDSDGVVTHDDFYFAQECLSDRRTGISGGPENNAGPGCRFTDFDGDHDADILDFAEFQNLFRGP